MTTEGSDVQNPLSRVADLERRYRRLERSAALAVVLALGLSGIALYLADPRRRATEVEARRFTLRDSEGRGRAVLTVRDDGAASLIFSDRENVPRATIGVSVNGVPALALSDDDGNLRAAIVVATDGTASVGLFDPNAKPRARLMTNQKGLPAMELLDEQVRVRAVLSVDQERTLLRIADTSGQTRVGLGLSHDLPGVAVFDESGTTIEKIP